MLMYSECLELRGCEKKISEKSGNPYLVFYLEEASGNPQKFVCRNEDVFKPSYKKGQKFTGVFELNRFGNVNLIGLEPEDERSDTNN